MLNNLKSKLVFKTYTPNQILLFPASLEEKIDQHHPVRIVNTIIERINIDPLIRKYKGGGSSSYHPRMMLKVLVYAYLVNLYHSRKIEAALKENIYFMWLAGMNQPDHNTINRFRSERLKDVLKEVFGQVVKLLTDQGLVSLQEIYLDGTKIQANANRYSFVWGGAVNRSRHRIEEQLKGLWAYTQQVAAEELNDTEPLQFEGIDAQQVGDTIRRIDQALQGKPIPRQIRKKIQYAKRCWPKNMAKNEQKVKILGQRRSYSKTDPDATFMPMKEDPKGKGQLKAGYNFQISTSDQFILNYSVHQNTNDINTLKPHVEEFKALYHQTPRSLCTDAGYGSEENYAYLEKEGIENFVKYYLFDKEQIKANKNDPFRIDNLFYNEEKDIVYCPIGQPMTRTEEHTVYSETGFAQQQIRYQAQNCNGCPMRGPCFKGKGNRTISINPKLRKYKRKVRENLLSELGLRHRKKRVVDVEPVFAFIKHNKGFRRFNLRGFEKVKVEVGLLAIANNLSKLVA